MRTIFIFVFSGFLMFALTGCDKTKEQFNLTKKAPDEFAVVKRAPLEMPPEYTLRPPQPGAARPQEKSTDEQVRTTFLGQNGQVQPAPVQAATKGESLLLQKAGAAHANPNIRTLVDKETAALGEEKMIGVDKLKKMIGKKVEPPASEVDAMAEAQRIKANKEAGKPVTDGATPILGKDE